MYQKVEDLLIKSVLGEDFSNELESVTEFYGDDLSPYRLSPQLSILASQLIKFKEALNFQNILEYIRSISLREREILSEVVKRLRIILVNPATNAISERSFSALRRLKTYLLSTMCQTRLNAIILLHVHKEKTDLLSVLKIANTFATTEHRIDIFGTFSCKDL